MINISETIQVAVIGKAQGIKGELKINLIGGNAEKFAGYRAVAIGDKEYAVESFKSSPNGSFIKLKGVDDRSAAERLTNCAVYVDKKLVPIAEDEYFIVDLIGSEIVIEGVTLGVLTDVLQSGAADVYCVDGSKPFMFPALKKVLKSVDVQNKRIELDKGVFEQIVCYRD